MQSLRRQWAALPIVLSLALATACAGAAELAIRASPGKPANKPPLGGGAGAATEDPMDKLRERLAEKLGAGKSVEKDANANVLRVVALPGAASNDVVLTPSPAGTSASRSGAPRPAARKPAPVHPDHWSYLGEGGPDHWGQMKSEFSLCSSGKRQSPIDIRDGIAVQLDPVRFSYQASNFRVIDTGHTVQVNVAAGNRIEVMGRQFELQQFHFHRPSEERIDGRQFDMVAHLVHKDAEGKLAVVAVLLDRGSVQPLIQKVWNNLPLEKNEELAAQSTIDLNELLPADRRYYTYMGSLTTPPCSEGVLWMVMKTPVSIAPEQIGVFSRLYPMNARPIQSAGGRMIKGPAN